MSFATPCLTPMPSIYVSYHLPSRLHRAALPAPPWLCSLIVFDGCLTGMDIFCRHTMGPLLLVRNHPVHHLSRSSRSSRRHTPSAAMLQRSSTPSVHHHTALARCPDRPRILSPPSRSYLRPSHPGQQAQLHPTTTTSLTRSSQRSSMMTVPSSHRTPTQSRILTWSQTQKRRCMTVRSSSSQCAAPPCTCTPTRCSTARSRRSTQSACRSSMRTSCSRRLMRGRMCVMQTRFRANLGMKVRRRGSLRGRMIGRGRARANMRTRARSAFVLRAWPAISPLRPTYPLFPTRRASASLPRLPLSLKVGTPRAA